MQGSHHADGKQCFSKNVRADLVEEIVWDDVRSYIENPGEVVVALEEKMKEQLLSTKSHEDEIKDINSIVATKSEERQRVITMFRKGLIESEEMEQELGQ